MRDEADNGCIRGSLTLALGGEEQDVVVRPFAEVEQFERIALGRLVADLESTACAKLAQLLKAHQTLLDQNL